MRLVSEPEHRKNMVVLRKIKKKHPKADEIQYMCHLTNTTTAKPAKKNNNILYRWMYKHVQYATCLWVILFGLFFFILLYILHRSVWIVFVVFITFLNYLLFISQWDFALYQMATVFCVKTSTKYSKMFKSKTD